MKKALSILFAFYTLSFCAQVSDPSVYGGKEEWKRFLHDQMVYPEVGLRDKEEGNVKVKFKVSKEGVASNFTVLESVGTSVDNEAIRLLSLIEWLPAMQDGVVYDAEHTVSIPFAISKYKKWVKERGYEKTAYTDMPVDSSIAVYESADKVAKFDNQEKSFPEFVYSNMEYPELAKVQGLQGSVVMSFIVEKNGRTSNIRIKTGIGGGCNEEAIRLIGLTKWKPAHKGGKYIRYRMYHTMQFKLDNNFKDNSSGSQRVGGN